MGRRKSWQTYERDAATRHRGKHRGGPGEPDYTRGSVQGEVKSQKAPLNRTEVMSECNKGRTEIVSRSGFTESAREYVTRYRPGVKLVDES